MPIISNFPTGSTKKGGYHIYGFEINDEGHLMLGYDGDEPPAFSLEEDGHLYYDIPPKLDLGQVSRGTNPNLLDNWYFAGGGSQQSEGQFPINQRGKANYGSNGYTIDRWYNTNGQIDLTPNGVKISTTNSACNFNQLFEGLELLGQTVTVSALVDSSGEQPPEFQIGIYATNSTAYASVPLVYTPYERKTGLITVTGKIPKTITRSFLCCSVVINLNQTGSLTVRAIKVELGDQQTLAHKEGNEWVLNDPPPNYALELEKCKRYLQPWSILAEADQFYPSTKSVTSIGHLPVEMRAKPTLLDGCGIAYAPTALGNWVTAKTFTFTATNNYTVGVQAILQDSFTGDITPVRLYSVVKDTYTPAPLWLTAEP